MKKILYVATITQHFYCFHLPSMKMFKELGWQVDVASHGDIELPYCDNRYELSICRSPADKNNITAYRELKKIIDENDYDIIHCHTPMGGVLARLAARKKRKHGTKVLYTAHGFHFYKGAPKLNWLIFYPIEFIMSFITDCLITINDEDFEFARKHLKAKITEKVNGVGYDTDKYFTVSSEEKKDIRKKLGYGDDEKLLIYVAEMNANKNQSMLIKTLKILKEKRNDVRLLLVGDDNYDGRYVKLVEELGVKDSVDFLGYRDDVDALLHACDMSVGSSVREGLPVNVMEALACGLPVVLSDNRGHRALTVNGENGYTVAVNDCEKMAELIDKVLSDRELYEKLSKNASELIKPYSKENVLSELTEIYNRFIG